jgi:hypothetical protein
MHLYKNLPAFSPRVWSQSTTRNNYNYPARTFTSKLQLSRAYIHKTTQHKSVEYLKLSYKSKHAYNRKALKWQSGAGALSAAIVLGGVARNRHVIASLRVMLGPLELVIRVIRVIEL